MVVVALMPAFLQEQGSNQVHLAVRDFPFCSSFSVNLRTTRRHACKLEGCTTS